MLVWCMETISYTFDRQNMAHVSAVYTYVNGAALYVVASANTEQMPSLTTTGVIGQLNNH